MRAEDTYGREKRISEEELKKDVAAAEARIRKTDDFTSPEEFTGN